MRALIRLLRRLLAPARSTCPTCGHALDPHPDGGPGGVCQNCDDERKTDD